MIRALICKVFGHKYGEVYDFNWYYVARKCLRCGHIIKQDKQTIRELFFGFFDED